MRSPLTGVRKVSLLVLARERLRIARHSGGMSWAPIAGNEDSADVRVTVVALVAGAELQTDDIRCSSGSHVQVLQGVMVFDRGHSTSAGWPSDLVVIDEGVQCLRARSDAVVLVTTSRSRGAPSGFE